jgi:hypothetical protein
VTVHFSPGQAPARHNIIIRYNNTRKKKPKKTEVGVEILNAVDDIMRATNPVGEEDEERQ